MSSTHSRRLFQAASGMILAGAIALSTTAAFADSGTGSDSSVPGASSTTVPAIKAKCDAAIAGRLTALGIYDGRLAGAADVTAAHRSALEGIISTTESSLTTLKTEIDAATTVAQLRPLCTAIVVNNRVYALVQHQDDLTIRIDHASASTAGLQSKSADLQSKIDALKAAGKNTTKAQADLTKMNAYISSATNAEAGRVDSLLSLTPASYNANHNVVAPFTVSARHAEAADTSATAWGLRTLVAIQHIH